MARWVRRRDRAGRVLAIANQKRGVLARYGITREEADRAAWTIGGDGRLEGAAAVNRVWRELGGGWAALARAHQLRPMAVGGEAVYPWFARPPAAFPRFRGAPGGGAPGSGCA